MASRPPLPLALAAITAVVAVTLAARAPLPQPPVDSAAATAASADSAPADSAVADSATATTLGADAPLVTAHVAPAPAADAPHGAWPVDPATGMTLVNGTPVVGRVFIQHKTDHLQKMGTVAQVLARETQPADAPVADASYTPAPREQARRFRGIMVQATLWDMDHKRTAAERRYYRSVTQAP